MAEEKSSRTLVITQGDITMLRLSEGALVNPSNTGLILGSGVSGAIARRGGPYLQQTLHMARSQLKKNRLDPGKAIDTEPGQLGFKRLIHVAIVGAKKINDRLISNAILNAYDMADELELKQVAFPAIGCGVAKFPLEKFLEIFWKITAQELPRMQHVQEVYLCMYEGKDFEAACAYAQEYAEKMPATVNVKVSETGFIGGMFG
jgi:O-acetyl-ADP-ribose deacetylase